MRAGGLAADFERAWVLLGAFRNHIVQCWNLLGGYFAEVIDHPSFPSSICPPTPLIRTIATSGSGFRIGQDIGCSDFRGLQEGQTVEFDVVKGPKGFQAENVRPV